MLLIKWRQSARLDVFRIVRHIAQYNKSAALKMKRVFESCVLPVSEHPYLYKASERMPGCREIVAHPNYIVFYRVSSSFIEVVNVVHARRNFP